MFSLYDTLFNKIAFTVFLFIMRMALFFHCQTHPPVYVLTGIHILIIQILNILRCHERDLYIFQFQSSETRTASDVV